MQDINPWFQFGKDGFTTPPATAHKGSCTYSPVRELCPLPLDCRHRTLPKEGAEKEFIGHGVCDELSIRTRLGPLVAVETDPIRCEQIYTAALAEVLTAFADGVLTRDVMQDVDEGDHEAD